MRAVMVLFDTLSRHFLESYGSLDVQTPNFTRLEQHCATFDQFYSASLPCMIYVDKYDDGTGTLARRKKDSFYWYQKVIASNGNDL